MCELSGNEESQKQIRIVRHVGNLNAAEARLVGADGIAQGATDRIDVVVEDLGKTVVGSAQHGAKTGAAHMAQVFEYVFPKVLLRELVARPGECGMSELPKKTRRKSHSRAQLF